MVGIYKITNCINGKCYIGQSRNIESRFKNHRNTASNPNDRDYNYPLYRAIRKYGIDNFLFEVIEECNIDELNEKEIYYIEKYGSYGKNGYNQDRGGTNASHYNKLSDDLVKAIINRLKTSLDGSEQIGKEFGVSSRMIRGINSGECCYQESETYPIRPKLFTLEESNDDNIYQVKKKIYYCKVCGRQIITDSDYCVDCAHKMQRKVKRPEPLELAKMVKENGFMAVGRMYGVDGNSVKKWCDIYGIPHLKNDLIKWYNDKMGITECPRTENKKEKVVRAKRVRQIDPNTNEILNIFESENAAARFLGKKKGARIGDACNGIINMIYGYKWSFDT